MLSFRIFVLLVLLKSISTCMDDQCREFAFPGYYFFYGERLINHVIRTIKVPDQDNCELQCYLEHNCVSINFEFTGSHKCDLNNSTHKEHEKDLEKRDGYVYHGAINACGKSPCQNNATCQTGFTNKGYRCLCATGFTGDHCKDDINECKEKSNKCDANAVCNNTKGSYVCTCKAGYTGDGQKCEDIDECTNNSHICDLNAVCNNTNGSYECTCKNGYTGDGHSCADIDECAQDIHNCSKVGALCNNTQGSFYCTCKPGFTGDGHNCTAFIIDSTILSDDQYYLYHLYHFLAPAVGNISQWLLCYRQSSDGDLDTTFHEKCDGKQNTVTIVKEKEFVFGGYTDVPWESTDEGQYKYGVTSKAFIFSLRNKENLGPFKSMVKNSREAIHNHIYYGPTFGTDDIRIDKDGNSKKNQSTANFGNDYSVPNNVQDGETILAGVSKFHPDEVEVFYLKVSYKSAVTQSQSYVHPTRSIEHIQASNQ